MRHQNFDAGFTLPGSRAIFGNRRRKKDSGAPEPEGRWFCNFANAPPFCLLAGQPGHI
jgi:hypothetical protein